MSKNIEENWFPVEDNQVNKNIEDTIKEGLNYFRVGKLVFAVSQLSLALQLIANEIKIKYHK